MSAYLYIFAAFTFGRADAKYHRLESKHPKLPLVIPNPSATLRVNSVRMQVAVALSCNTRNRGCNAHYYAQFPFFPTHLIPHGVYPERSRRVRNDNTSFGPVNRGIADFASALLFFAPSRSVSWLVEIRVASAVVTNSIAPSQHYALVLKEP
jgi:hypothetical protein